ncbi:hypothetical protein [Cellulomonas oligotrophica]|uniref:C-terminal processing protease CtpA/Prc n=1 Tax=Cellulomonas oligotrophica TaxID=931536 RepID=A0A7Y9FH50_9CELL|nr:hypothetical protein [Cellulomonas oligotrophica]NYD86827.1 C-terminal processing protease CtpA/Prc [Cellulomonas oligotrophica]GIG32387.1 hypothetical protein Col01nite_15460 [Cellulomonas oligotrophica]
MGRRVTMTRADVKARARTAREFHQVALERVELAGPGPSEVAQVAASNAVHAAIAAADAICGITLGEHASGSDHREAVNLLRTVPGEGTRLAAKLQRLLSRKSSFTYGGFCTRDEAEQATKDAAALIDELDRRSL